MSPPRAFPVALVAARELRQSLRGRWFLLAAGSFLALSLALSALGLAGSERSGLAGFDRTTASLLNLALLFVPLLTLSVGGLSVAGELEDGALGQLLSQPITRAELVLGKYAGVLAAVSAAVLAGFGAAGAIVGLATGGGSAATFLALVGLTLLLSAATVALGVLLSVWLRSRARVVGAAFAAWLGLVYLSDLGAVGLIVARHLRPVQVFALALLNPVQQARVLGTLALSHRLDLLGPVGLYGRDALGTAGLVAALVGALLALAVGCVGGAVSIFRKAVVP
ncbi:MAG TPA: ABC transporter permease [Myxococcaceae bacterium]|nr:ABC transporter permease [Myxococcaceae bacterium]